MLFIITDMFGFMGNMNLNGVLLVTNMLIGKGYICPLCLPISGIRPSTMITQEDYG